jgi:hypothetical protein
MAKKEKDILKKLGVPWITKDGFLNMAKFPIDSTLKQAVGKNEEEFRSSCRTLISMYVAGRLETAIFLYGLLIHNNKNIERKEIIVEALGYVKTKESADLLFSAASDRRSGQFDRKSDSSVAESHTRELHQTVSSNSTRKYINSILKSLQRFPLENINEGFETLLLDKKWSYRMKNKFKAILNGDDFRYYG